MLSEVKQLSKKEKKLILINSMLAVAGAFGNYFAARWTVSFDNPLQNLIKQAACQMITYILFYFFTSSLTDKLRISFLFGFSFLVGISGYTVFLLSVLSGHIVAANILYGFLMGITSGIYSACYNQISLTCTDGKSRISYISINQSLSTFSSVSGPVIMAVVLLTMNGGEISNKFYFLFFAVTVLLYAVCALLGFKLKLDKTKKRLKMKGVFFSKGNTIWNLYLVYNIVFGIMAGVSGGLGGIYIISFKKYPSMLYLFVLGGVTLVNTAASYLFGRIFRKADKPTLYLISSLMDGFAFIVSVFFYNMQFGIVVIISCMFLRGIAGCIRFGTELMLNMDVMKRFLNENDNVFSRYYARELVSVIAKMFAVAGIFICSLFLSEYAVTVISAIIGFGICNIAAALLYGIILHKAAKLNYT